jgi:hypothetical protein
MITSDQFKLDLIHDCKVLAKHRARLLTSMEVVELATAVYDKQLRIESEKPKPAKRPANVTGKGLNDEEWIASLMQEPHLEGVDVRREISACLFWCKNNKKLASRMRIVNWLNRAERTVTAKASGATFATGLRPPPPVGPKGWLQWLNDNMVSSDHPAFGQLTAALNCKLFHMLPASWQQRATEACK